MDSLQWIQQFHLIRPYWLLALLPLALVLWLSVRTQTHSRSWASVIDKRLLPHLLQGVSQNKKSAPVTGLFVAGLITVMALAGPAFSKRPQPVFKTQSALVILLDLSRSMDATDIKPSRLSRAHFKINDILKMRKEGQTALIAYAANAYVVSPLTDDADTIASQVPALETHIMPAQGSRLDIALEKAQQLFHNAGYSEGDLLIITDSVNSKDIEKLKELNAKHFSSSILAVGTKEGAPIAIQQGGFLKDRNGAIVIPKLDTHKMRSAALAGGGRFSLLSANDRDINYLLSAIDINRSHTDESLTGESQKLTTDIWYEEGPWLILLIIPFAAYAFRKGLIFALLIFILPLPQPAQAFGWSDLWNNPDQQGAKALQQEQPQQAAELFNDPQWKATAQYKAGDYQTAAETLNDINTAEANYNRGNALAKANDIENAIKAYERALEINPDHEDAKYNKQLLEQAKQQQNKDSQNSDEKKDQQDKQDQQQKGDGKNSEQNNSEQNNENNSSENQSEQNPEQGKENQSQKQSDNQSENNSENNSDKQSENKQNNEDEKQQAQQSAEDKQQQDEKQADRQDAQATENQNESDKEQTDKERKARQQQLLDETPDLEQQQAQQWLKKIPDDPGGLLRRKFKYQYSREENHDENNPW